MQVVCDKFLATHNVVEACEKVRKADSKADAGKRDRLKRAGWISLKKQMNWTNKGGEKWESMALERFVMGMAYEMRLVNQGIYELKDGGYQKALGELVCVRPGDAGS